MGSNFYRLRNSYPMKINLRYFIFITTILITIYSCTSIAKLYRFEDKDRIYAGQLSDSIYLTLKQFLTNTTNANLADTIIIKYDYNNEGCCSLLDQKKDDYVMAFVTTHQEKVQKTLSTRQNVSVFDFREPGNNLNKIKKWTNL